MVDLVLITLYDKISGVYDQPSCFYNESDMKRRVAAAYKNSDFAGDVQVFVIGHFDTFQGRLNSLQDPVFVGTCADIVAEVYTNA